MTRVSRAVMFIALVAVLTSGCDTAERREKGGNGAAMNMQGAAEHADAMLDATIDAVVPQLQWAHHVTTIGSCDVSRRRKIMTIISSERRGNLLGVVERYWKRKGYRITAVRASKERPAIFATSPDGFGISLVFGYAGQANLEVATPCVMKSDVAEPASPPNGPAYPPGGIPTPNVRSAFWSVEEPVRGTGGKGEGGQRTSVS
ncbi:hypothetical protein [Streptomyces lavendofoliae]|uniref:hypothetical protein n=1 Tax=Streptomyces lavendofoliae TaxID=67314 RepID=UPI00300E9F30